MFPERTVSVCGEVVDETGNKCPNTCSSFVISDIYSICLKAFLSEF